MSRTGIRHRPVRGEGVAPPNGMAGNRAKGRLTARKTQECSSCHVLSRTKEQRARGIAKRHAGWPGLHPGVSVRRGRSATASSRVGPPNQSSTTPKPSSLEAQVTG